MACATEEKGAQEMLGKVAALVAAVGRTASMVLGLALVLALMVGVATAAFGTDGDVFKAAGSKLASYVKVRGNVNGDPAPIWARSPVDN